MYIYNYVGNYTEYQRLQSHFIYCPINITNIYHILYFLERKVAGEIKTYW